MDTKSVIKKVSGITEDGECFEDKITFTMYKPDGDYYGTGYLMSIMMNGARYTQDVRYEGTTDIDLLSEKWIKNYYGPNARKVEKIEERDSTVA